VIASVAIVALSFNFYANAASNSKDEQAIREVENGMIAARLGANGGGVPIVALHRASSSAFSAVFNFAAAALPFHFMASLSDPMNARLERDIQSAT
jgi:hypothetical protein